MNVTCCREPWSEAQSQWVTDDISNVKKVSSFAMSLVHFLSGKDTWWFCKSQKNPTYLMSMQNLGLWKIADAKGHWGAMWFQILCPSHIGRWTAGNREKGKTQTDIWIGWHHQPTWIHEEYYRIWGCQEAHQQSPLNATCSCESLNSYMTNIDWIVPRNGEKRLVAGGNRRVVISLFYVKRGSLSANGCRGDLESKINLYTLQMGHEKEKTSM